MQLLERAPQLQILSSALGQAKSGQGCVALVYGEAGIGKTTLVEQFIQEQAKDWRTLSGACDSLFTPRPLGPLHDIALQAGGKLLSLLESESNRGAIFSACLNELKEQRIILVIEDIHWADEATLDLLKYLGRRIRQTSSLIILTYRDDELGVDHPLRTLLGDLSSFHALYRVQVPAFSRDAVQELANHKTVDSAALHRLTNGNPFFVTEVLAAESGIPETVRDAVLARAAKLSPPARRVLEAAAVIGSRADPGLLSSVSEAESGSLQECISKGMLQTQGEHYAFRHELARQTIYESIPSQRKTLLHRKILDALQESPVTRENLSQLAHHAQTLHDPQAVLEYAPLAAWWASELGAHREAAAHYKAALEYGKRLSAEKRAELLDAYSDECSLIDQRREAKLAQEEALRLWQELGQTEREGRAYRRLAEIDHDFVFSPEREQNIKQAIELLETLPPSRELARAYSHMARLQTSLNRADGLNPMDWGSRAMELAEKLGDIETLVHALTTIGAWEMCIGKRVEGQAKLERSLGLALEHDLQFHAARALGNLSNELTLAQDYTASLHYVERGIEYCVQHDLDQWLVGFLTDRAVIRFRWGQWDEAEQDIQTVLGLRNNREAVEIIGISSLLLLFQARRGVPLAPDILKVVQEFLPKLNDLDIRCTFAALFAEIAWLKGNLAGSRAEAEPTYQFVSQYYKQSSAIHDLAFSELSYWMWRAGAIKKPLPGVIEPYASQIRGDWQSAAAQWEKYGCPYEQGMALMDGDEAAQLAALEIFERLGARPVMEILKQKMRTEGAHVPRGPRPSTRENLFGLTAREMEVLACLSKGLSNNAIAEQLSLSTRTVEHHIAAILQKMDVQSRNQAVARALKENLLPSA